MKGDIMTDNENKIERLIRLPEVKHRTGLARSTIYLYMSLGSFPANRSLGQRSVAWLESEIEAWMKDRMERRK